MSLSKHINTERLLQESRDHRSHAHHLTAVDVGNTNYGARYGTYPLPKYKLPSKGTDAEAAYQIVHDELALDGTPLLNLASFVHTWMPGPTDKLMQENMSKNLIDQVSAYYHWRVILPIKTMLNADLSINATYSMIRMNIP